MGVNNVLPLAASTLTKVFARRLLSVRGWAYNVDDFSCDIASTLAYNLNLYLLARQSPKHEYWLPINVGHGFPKAAHPVQLEGYSLSSFYKLSSHTVTSIA